MSTDNGLPKDLNKLKVAELKEELDNRGLPIDGLKKDRALDPELEGHYETPTAAQKALAQPVPKKKVEDIAPVLQRKAQQEASDDLADVDMTHDGASDPEPVSQRGDAGEKESKHDTAVGHSMVEGPTEAAQEIDDIAAAKMTQDDLDTMPAALDDEVTAIVAKEEVKATLPPTPSPPPRATPLPSTPPLPASVDAESSSRKRAASRSSSPEKRRRIAMDVDEDLDLDVDAPSGPGDSADSTKGTYPSGSSRVLYILNLRRPLLIPSLHAHLFTSSTPSCSSSSSPFPASSSRPFVDPDCPGVWLGPIKDHAFAAYDSVDAAEEAKARVEGKVWPEDTGAELEVRYMPEEAVQGVVEKQQAAWKAGRQRLTIQISPVGEVEDGAVAEGKGQGPGQRRIRVEVLDQKGQPYAMPSAPVDAPSRPKGRQPYTALQALGQAQHQSVRQGGMGMAGMGRGPPAGLGMGADMSIRGRGNMGAPNAMVPRGADSYVPGRNAPAYQHQQQPGARGSLPAQQRMPMSMSSDSGGDGRLVKAVKRTRAQPALIWREGPSAGDR